MSGERQESWEEQWYIWAIVAGLVLAGVLWLAFASNSKEQTAPAANKPAHGGKASIAADPRTLPGFEKLTELEKFLAWLEYNAPSVVQITRRDLADGSSLPVPSVDMKKSLIGGDATDMMALAMGLDERDPRHPVPGKQEWQLKTFTFPKSGATYMEIDLMQEGQSLAPDARRRMREWDLAQLCPPLAAVDNAQWTDDERQYAHYLTVRQMGMPDTEVGFAALWAAYASNFALWQGAERSVPAAAYYALAAAHFEQHLAAGGPPTPRATAVTWMVCGECHRLLGRMDDARRCFAMAQQLAAELDQAKATDDSVDALHEPEKQVLALYLRLLEAGDLNLQRQPYTGLREPPTGWFIELLLPAINGELAVTRSNWAVLRDTAEINSAIVEHIANSRSDG